MRVPCSIRFPHAEERGWGLRPRTPLPRAQAMGAEPSARTGGCINGIISVLEREGTRSLRSPRTTHTRESPLTLLGGRQLGPPQLPPHSPGHVTAQHPAAHRTAPVTSQPSTQPPTAQPRSRHSPAPSRPPHSPGHVAAQHPAAHRTALAAAEQEAPAGHGLGQRAARSRGFRCRTGGRAARPDSEASLLQGGNKQKPLFQKSLFHSSSCLTNFLLNI